MVAISSPVFIGVLAASVCSVNALGCYSSGFKFQDLGGSVTTAIIDFCKFASGDFTSGEQKSKCINVGSNHINFKVQDETDIGQSLSYEDCYSNFDTEYGGCSRGSEQTHGDNWYQIDPNSGAC